MFYTDDDGKAASLDSPTSRTDWIWTSQRVRRKGKQQLRGALSLPKALKFFSWRVDKAESHNLIILIVARWMVVFNTDKSMRLLLAIILPWLQFFTIGRPIAGIVCLLLQITIIGWIPAAIWSVYALSQYKTDKKIERALSSRG